MHNILGAVSLGQLHTCPWAACTASLHVGPVCHVPVASVVLAWDPERMSPGLSPTQLPTRRRGTEACGCPLGIWGLGEVAWQCVSKSELLITMATEPALAPWLALAALAN